MKSYIKLYGPPILSAIKALEKMSLNFPQVCIMNIFMEIGASTFETTEGTMSYFDAEPTDMKARQRCFNIVSKSGLKLGDSDFIFEWFEEPSPSQLSELIGKIDETLTPIGVRYTIQTK